MNTHTEELLYSYEKLCELLAHPDNEIVRWSLGHLNRLYYPRIPENIFDVFQQDDSTARRLAATLIADRGNLETHGPKLRQLLEEMPPNDSFGTIVDLCRQFKDKEALRIVDKKIADSPDDAAENALFARLQFACECKPKKALAQLKQFSWNRMATGHGSPVLVLCMLPAMPESLLRDTVAACRKYGRPDSVAEDTHLSLIENLLNCYFFTRALELNWMSTETLLDEIHFFVGRSAPVSEDFLSSLTAIRQKSVSEVPSVIFDAFETLAKEKAWDVTAWCGGLNIDETRTPFQKFIAQVYIVLDELHKPLGRANEKRTANSEAELTTALFLRATVAEDDQLSMDRAGDRVECIRKLALSTRPQLFLDFEATCLALGPDIAVSVLADVLTDISEMNYYPILRATTLIPRLEKVKPGVCAPLARGLVNVIMADLGDFTNEAASAALEPMGDTAINVVLREAFRNTGDGVEIYLESILTAWPCRRVVDAIVDAEVLLDEISIENMAEIGAPEFIPMLLPHAKKEASPLHSN
ncbi:MAG: hypothetical protein JXR76_00055 [Deltaproteobacteria bacterium]|nr:hypothetical protein [Deltaproteobacteria bacterium]